MIALWAALAMAANDLFAVLLVQAEARNRAVLSGALDTCMWAAGIATTTISVTALQGHDGPLKGLVVAAVSVANFAASWGAVKIGERLIRQQACACGCPVKART
jgi:hypothetical protein